MPDMGPRTAYERGKSEWFLDSDEERIIYNAIMYALSAGAVMFEDEPIAVELAKEFKNEP